jgi:hypothetical protein
MGDITRIYRNTLMYVEKNIQRCQTVSKDTGNTVRIYRNMLKYVENKSKDVKQFRKIQEIQTEYIEIC